MAFLAYTHENHQKIQSQEPPGMLREAWKGPGKPFGDTSGGTIGRNHAHPARPSQGRPKGAPGAGPTRPGPARESQNAGPTAPTRPGPARESQKGQGRKRLEGDFNLADREFPHRNILFDFKL